MREQATKIYPERKTANDCPSDLRTVGSCSDFIEYLKSKIRQDMEEAVRKDLTPTSKRDHLAGRVEVVKEILTDVEKALTINE